MEKLIEFLDDLFERYDVAEEDIAKVGTLIADINGELNMDGEDFVQPSIEEEEDGYEEADDEE